MGDRESTLAIALIAGFFWGFAVFQALGGYEPWRVAMWVGIAACYTVFVFLNRMPK